MGWEESDKNHLRPQSVILSLWSALPAPVTPFCGTGAICFFSFSNPRTDNPISAWWDGDGRNFWWKFWRKKKNDGAVQFAGRKRFSTLLWPQYRAGRVMEIWRREKVFLNTRLRTQAPFEDNWDSNFDSLPAQMMLSPLSSRAAALRAGCWWFCCTSYLSRQEPLAAGVKISNCSILSHPAFWCLEVWRSIYFVPSRVSNAV